MGSGRAVTSNDFKVGDEVEFTVRGTITSASQYIPGYFTVEEPSGGPESWNLERRKARLIHRPVVLKHGQVWEDTVGSVWVVSGVSPSSERLRMTRGKGHVEATPESARRWGLTDLLYDPEWNGVA